LQGSQQLHNSIIGSKAAKFLPASGLAVRTSQSCSAIGCEARYITFARFLYGANASIGLRTPRPPPRRKNKTSGFYEGTEIAVDQLVEHVIAMK
jgi:hypothetical protein